MPESIIRMDNVVKVYPPSVLALDGASIDIEKGEIHSIIGENGAGKSTLMKALYGLVPIDSGSISCRGSKSAFPSPRAAVAAGVGMVHQEFMLIPSYTVRDNVALGVEPVKGLSYDKATAGRRVAALVAEYGLSVDPEAVVGELSVAAQQKVEILKLLYRDVDVLIMDEPTAVLTPQEIDELFGRLRALRDAGKTVIFISHKLNEVLALSDRITVMRKGRVVGTMRNEGLRKEDLARAMVGRDVVFATAKGEARPGGDALVVEGLSARLPGARTGLEGVSLSVRSGEIVGVAGVEGNGQRELVEAIVGLRGPEAGSIRLSGRDLAALPLHERRALMAYVSQDRKGEGSAPGESLRDNLAMTHHLGRTALRGRLGLMSARRMKSFADDVIAKFGVVAPSSQAAIGSLSGGNQQKAIVGREFSLGAGFVLLDQPTRGLDVGSIEYIQERIVAARDAGAACLLVSSDLDEIFALADRIVVLHKGRLVADRAASAFTRGELGEYMLGVKEEARC